MTIFSDKTELLVTSWTDAEWWVDVANSRFNEAETEWIGMDDHGAINKLISGCRNLGASIDALLNKYTGFYPRYRACQLFTLSWEYDNETMPTDDLSMRAILDEMFTADNEELKQFIALIDAYRQSLWNKPFDVNYWAAVARGFEKWEF